MQYTSTSTRQRPKLLLSRLSITEMSSRLGGSRIERAEFLASPGSYIRKHGDFSKFSDIQIITNEKELENVNGGAVFALVVLAVVAAGVHMTVVATNAVVAVAAAYVYAAVKFWGPGNPPGDKGTNGLVGGGV